MITQKKYFAPETQFICDECSEAVTNPICPSCLTEEIEAWLTLYPNLRQELIPQLQNYLRKLKSKFAGLGTACIKCRNNRAFVCPYCFTNRVFDELIRINASKIILKEFFEFFNYDLHHTGYTKKAEKLGIV